MAEWIKIKSRDQAAKIAKKKEIKRGPKKVKTVKLSHPVKRRYIWMSKIDL